MSNHKKIHQKYIQKKKISETTMQTAAATNFFFMHCDTGILIIAFFLLSLSFYFMLPILPTFSPSVLHIFREQQSSTFWEFQENQNKRRIHRIFGIELPLTNNIFFLFFLFWFAKILISKWSLDFRKTKRIPQTKREEKILKREKEREIHQTKSHVIWWQICLRNPKIQCQMKEY